MNQEQLAEQKLKEKIVEFLSEEEAASALKRFKEWKTYDFGKAVIAAIVEAMNVGKGNDAKYVNVYEDGNGRFISDSYYETHNDAFEGRDTVNYLGTVAIIGELPDMTNISKANREHELLHNSTPNDEVIATQQTMPQGAEAGIITPSDVTDTNVGEKIKADDPRDRALTIANTDKYIPFRSQPAIQPSLDEKVKAAMDRFMGDGPWPQASKAEHKPSGEKTKS